MKTKEFRMKKLVIISALILTIIMGIAFIAGVTAVTDTTSVDPASLSLSLFKKKTDTTPPATITGNAIDDSGNTIATVTVKAGEEVGRVRDDFYGVNDEALQLTSSYPGWLDLDCDKVKDIPSNTKLNRELFENSGMSYIRIWSSLQQINPIEGEYNQTKIKELMNEAEYANSKGYRILLRTNWMPYWIQDRNGSHCNSANYNSCPPVNNTKFAIIINYLINNITQVITEEKLDVEILNEPWGDTWLNNASNEDRITTYAEMFNITRNYIKEKHPNVSVGWTSTYDTSFGGSPANTYYRTKGLLESIGNFSDFINLHAYPSNLINSNYLYYNLVNLTETCNIFGANCSRIGFGEWNVWSGSYTFEYKRYYAEISYAYQSLLNYLPNNTTSVINSWNKWVSYNQCPSYYPEYPIKHPMWNELDMSFQPTYNVTKDFAHYHAGGNMIINSSSNNNSIKSVASLNPQGIWHITVINTATNNINVNIDVSSTGVEALKDLATETIYPVSAGIANVGVLTEYDVKHYEGIADYEPPVVEEKSSGGSSSSTSNKAVSLNELPLGTHEVVSIKPNTSTLVATSEIITDFDTTITTSESQEEENLYGPVKASEEDRRLYQEEYENELQGNSYTGALSLAVSNKSYLTIAIILLGSIICTALIISIIYRKKKREADKVKKLMDWVDKARELGYTNEKMKEMLAQYNWDKDLVEKVVGK